MSDIDVHLVCGKHTRSIKVSIDKRCKVVNFAGNYQEFKHSIWWKGLFVREIHILCDDFVVNLRKNNSPQLTSINADFLVKNIANKDCIIFENEEALSKEQIEEIKTMLVSYSNNQRVTSVELDLYMLKLLYCYILPSFMFMRTDLNWLNWCLQLVGDELQKVDADLIRDDRHIVKFATKLREKRAAFLKLSEEQKENLLKTSDEKFLNTIISHFRGDCLSLEELYNKSRKRVENLKECFRKESSCMVQDEEGDESVVEQDLYFEREESHRIWEEMVALKINIANIEYIKGGNVPVLQKKKNMKDAFSLPHNYMELHELRESLKGKVEDSYVDKLRLKSIAEGIKMAIQEVETFGESFGMESGNKEELKSFDPINELGSLCWQNCAEKVKYLLRDPKQCLSQLHLCFKEQLHLQISSLLSEQSLFQECSVDDANKVCKSDFISSTKSQESMQELHILKPFPDTWVGTIQKFKDRIYEQITKMCQMIQSSTIPFEKSEKKQIRKIYESILLSETRNDICKLFEMALKTYSEEMYSRVSSLSYSDLVENMIFSDERKDSAKNDVTNSVLHRKKGSICLASKIPLCESKKVSRISISFSRESKRFQDWRASYGPPLTDSVNSAFLRGSVSLLYEEADAEFRVLCQEKSQHVALHEVEISSNTLSPGGEIEKKKSNSFENVGKFFACFHSSLLSIEEFFSSNTLQGKLYCMVRTLKCISYSIINTENRFVTADDLIGILSVLFHSLSGEQLKRLCCELVLINNFISQDEQISLNGNALVHFMCALEALYRHKES